MMTIKLYSPKAADLIDINTAVELVATGFLFTEGPLCDQHGRRLLFSDLAGDVLRSWRPGEGVVEVRRPSGKSNGLAWDTRGRLIACEHVGRRVTRTEADGSMTVLASEWGGRPLNSPNDLVVKSDGSVYFSDPPYGLQDFYGIARPQDLPFQGVYRIGIDGMLSLLVDDFAAPNGLAFSPDESLLYVDDTERTHIRVFEVRPDGSLANGRFFFDYAEREPDWTGGPDGLKVDALGNIWATGPGGIWLIDPEGVALAVIPIPEPPSNLNWGDADRQALYITARTSIYRARVKVAGNAVSAERGG